MRRLDRTARFITAGAGLGAAFSAGSQYIGHALGIRPMYLLAGVMAWYVILIALLVRSKRTICN